MKRLKSSLLTLAALTAATAASGIAPSPAYAHPHVWVTVETTALVGADAVVSGLRHRWTFDELYSSFAVQGLDKKGGNNPTRDDLKELAQMNVDSLKEFGYFTHPQLLPQGAVPEKIAIKPPIDYFLEYKDGQLSLTFTLPLEKPAPAASAPLAFAVYDPSYFIAFQFAKDKPFNLAEGAPANCRIEQKTQASEQAAADRLSEAFSKGLGAPSGGSVMSDNVVVACGDKK